MELVILVELAQEKQMISLNLILWSLKKPLIIGPIHSLPMFVLNLQQDMIIQRQKKKQHQNFLYQDT